MLDLLFIPTALVYLIVVGSLFAYGLNFFYMTYVSWREYRAPQQQPRPPKEWPAVTVQLPIYNELYVAERAIAAAANLDYPADRLEIQVLDDSTDETAQIVAATTNRLQRRGLNVHHLQRENRVGFKAGALAAGLQKAQGEFIAIFDADFVVPPDFLRRTLPHFSDERLAFVQTRWGHLNRSYSALTLLQSIAIDAHFMIEQLARSRRGFAFNFNGTGGVWRRAAIEDAGGWTADTLTEDLDLSYRAFLRGWRAAYLPEIEVPAELPASFSAYRRQQHRWARGSLECALKLLPQVWASTAPASRKLEATLHLTGYGVHLLLFGLTILYPLVLLLTRSYPNLITLFGIALLFNATALAPTLFFLVAQRQLKRLKWYSAPIILFLTALGAGMMLNTLRAALQVLRRREGVFERTPKFGIRTREQNWLAMGYRLDLEPIVYWELGFAALNLITVYLAFTTRNGFIGVYAAIFALGLLFTSGLTIAQSISLRRHPLAPRSQAPAEG